MVKNISIICDWYRGVLHFSISSYITESKLFPTQSAAANVLQNLFISLVNVDVGTSLNSVPQRIYTL